MAALNGQSNGYPEGQCTRYANERYHTLTGYYVPWSGNAGDWSGLAIANGWQVSNIPVIPSIICLAPGIQGASPVYGHVGIVESIQKNNVVITSDLNWGPNYTAVSTVSFSTGPGVTFIYATTGNSNKPIGSTAQTLTDTVSNLLSSNNTAISLAPNSDVSSFLWSLDQILDMRNPFNISANQDTLSALGISTTFVDPISWLDALGNNILDDTVALTIRFIFITIGVIIIIKVLSNFIDFSAIGQSFSGIAQTLATGALLA